MGKTKQRTSRFVKDRISSIEGLTLDDMLEGDTINPFLVKAIGLKSLDDLARFFVYQTLSRGIVTAFGYVLEDMVRSLSGGCKGRGDESWWDVEWNPYPGQTEFISVKSGSRTMDKDQVETFINHAKKLEKRKPNAKAALGFTYGRNLWDIIKNTVNKSLEGDYSDYIYMGKDLYGHLVKDSGHYKKVLSEMEEAYEDATAQQTLPQDDNQKETLSMVDLVERKSVEIATEMKNRYGSVDELIEDLF